MSSKKVRDKKKNQRLGKTKSNKAQLKEVLGWFGEQVDFDDFVFHGNTKWNPWNLVVLALLWAWSAQKYVTDAFEDASNQSRQLLGSVAVTTYQGLLKALVSWTPNLLGAVQLNIHRCLEAIGGKKFRIGHWVPLAMDGSRTTAPRTKSNEAALCAKNFGKGKTAKYRKSQRGHNAKKKHRKNESKLTPPQVWITLIWHVTLGIPWQWKLGPSTSSERGHVKEMVCNGHFARNTLFIGDAGFVGYETWKAIIDNKYHFMVRVGGNVRLLKDLGYYTERKKDIVYCWPNKAIREKQHPLTLRLVTCKVGKTKVHLLTSILNERELTLATMSELYEQRWGIELEFRSLKQIFQRRTLRCRNSDRAQVELEWSIVAMAIIELFTLKEQLARAPSKVDPHKISFANSLRALRKCLSTLHSSQKSDFSDNLANAVVDQYQRKGSKKARYQCKRKRPPKCGAPIITKASTEQRKKARGLSMANAV